MPRVLRDARSTRSARSGHLRTHHKRHASNHLQDQAREGPRAVAILLEPDLPLAEYAECNERHCKVQDLKHHATCTLAAASPCILHTQPRSGGVGGLCTKPGICHSWLNQKRNASSCRYVGYEFFQSDPCKLDSLLIHRCKALAYSRLKNTAQISTRTKRENT